MAAAENRDEPLLPGRPKPLTRSVVVCVLGRTTQGTKQSEEFVRQLAVACAKLTRFATFVTTCASGVQKTFGKHFHNKRRLFHIRRHGRESDGGVDLQAEHASHDQFFREWGDIYLMVEGDGGVEARVVSKRGAFVLPVACADTNLEKHWFVDDETWKSLAKRLEDHQSIELLAKSVVGVLELMIDRSIQLDPFKWCPHCAISHEVKEFNQLWKNKNETKPIPLGCVAGKPVLYGTLANVSFWLGIAVFVWFAERSCDCDPNGGLATYNTGWLWFFFFVVFLPIQLILEAVCCKYILYSLCQVTGPPKVMGRRLSFEAWTFTMLFLSVLSHMDTVSNGFFVATTLATHRCPRATGLTCMWKQVMNQSVFRFLPERVQEFADFHNVTLYCWAMVFFQPLHAIVVAYPIAKPDKWWPWIWPWSVDWKPKMKTEKDPNLLNTYRTLLDPNQNHGAALMGVAEVARMASVTSRNRQYAVKRAEDTLNGQTTTTTQEHALTHEDAIRCLHHALSLLQRAGLQTFCFGLLESAIQLNLQMTLLGLQRAAKGPMMRADSDLGVFATLPCLSWQLMFTIVLSGLMTLKRIYEAFAHLESARDIRRQTEDCVINGFKLQKIVREYVNMRWNAWWTRIGGFVLICAVVHAVREFWAVFYCPSSLLTAAAGCVQLDCGR